MTDNLTIAVPPGNTVLTAIDPNWKFLPSISAIMGRGSPRLLLFQFKYAPPIMVGNIG